MEIKAFFSFMQENAHLAQYVTVSAVGDLSNQAVREQFFSEKKTIISETIENLKSLESKFSSLKHSTSPHILQKPFFIPGSQIIIFSKIRFLENLINSLKNEAEEWETMYIRKALELFQSKDIIPQNCLVVCEIEQLKAKYKEIKFKLEATKTKLSSLKASFKEKISKKLLPSIQIEALQKILLVIHPSFDPALAFFCPCPSQDEFEIILFHPDFLFSENVTHIVQTFPSISASEFLTEIVHLVEKICTKIERTDAYSLSVIVGLCFRALFDKVYQDVKLFWLPELSFDLIGTLKGTKVSDVDPPRNCCPPGIKDDQVVSEIFRKDPNFSLAVEQIEFISFFTNPLDILHHVFHSLREIERATQVYGGGATTMLSFDVTFGLFLCILLSADIPELMRIAMFVDQYTPSRGLCPDFEFALAKLSTASIHLQNRAQSQISCV